MFLNYDINKSKEILKLLNITEKEEIIRILSRKGQLKILKRVSKSDGQLVHLSK